jgi:hypothetical protein
LRWGTLGDMCAHRVPLPVPIAGKPFRARDAKGLGVSPGRLRSSDLVAPFPGVRCVPAHSNGLEDRCDAYAVKMRAGDFFSHRTAAALHGLPLPRAGDDGRIHVSVFTPVQAAGGRGVHGHQMLCGSALVVLLRGKPVSSAADAWSQLAGQVTLDELVAVADSLLCGKVPKASVVDLTTAAARRAGRRGTGMLREAMSLMRIGAESPKETELRLLLQRAGLPEPELNIDIFDDRGGWLARGDLAYPQFKVLVEYDGMQHGTDRRQFVRDVERLEDLTRAGWRINRVMNEHLIRDPGGVIRRVSQSLRARGWRSA